MKDSDSFWIRHLLRRAGFGYSSRELEYYQELGYERTVEKLLAPESCNNAALEKAIKQMGFDYTSLRDLQRWWLYRMAFSRCPLQEKMTLFWHGHFATSDRKVNCPYAMYLQNVLLRKLALGNFHELLFAVSRDPAMIMYLDNQQNHKGKPNENYARELMELFTMGIGNYSEQDVKEAARAFTGWGASSAGFVFQPGQHDYGRKKFLGEQGNFGGEDIVRILVKQEATARFIARKLCRFFVVEEPDEPLVLRIAAVYHAGGYGIRKMLKALFTDSAFLSRKAYHAKIKSPSELVAGTVKTLAVKELDGNLPVLMERMGQSLFQPPNVKGWDGGPAWIAADKIMERFNFAAQIVSKRFDELERYSSAKELLSRLKLEDDEAVVSHFADLLLDSDLSRQSRQQLVSHWSSTVASGDDPDRALRSLVHLLMTLPTYQLC